jgi:hypothetical protein
MADKNTSKTVSKYSASIGRVVHALRYAKLSYNAMYDDKVIDSRIERYDKKKWDVVRSDREISNDPEVNIHQIKLARRMARIDRRLDELKAIKLRGPRESVSMYMQMYLESADVVGDYQMNRRSLVEAVGDDHRLMEKVARIEKKVSDLGELQAYVLNNPELKAMLSQEIVKKTPAANEVR